MKFSVSEAGNKLRQLIQLMKKSGRHANLVPRRYGTLQNRIKILDPDWPKPQDDLERWLKGDV